MLGVKEERFLLFIKTTAALILTLFSLFQVFRKAFEGDFLIVMLIILVSLIISLWNIYRLERR